MSSTAPMELGWQEVQDDRDRVTDASAEAATKSSVAAAQTQTEPSATARIEVRQTVNSSWVGIVFAVFALGAGLLLWTAVAVSGTYTRWLISVGVMAIILAVSFAAVGYAER